MDTKNDTTPEPPKNGIEAKELEPLLEWMAPVLPSHERSQRWYIAGGVAVVLGTAYGILTGSWSFAIVILLCGGVYFLIHNEKPPLKRMVITERGYLFEERFTRWEDCKGFWVLEMPNYLELHIDHQDPKRPDTVIQTGTMAPELVHQTIALFLKEESGKRENLIDTFIRICKL